MAVIKTKKASIYGEIYFFEMLANEKTAIYGGKNKKVWYNGQYLAVETSARPFGVLIHNLVHLYSQ